MADWPQIELVPISDTTLVSTVWC